MDRNRIQTYKPGYRSQEKPEKKRNKRLRAILLATFLLVTLVGLIFFPDSFSYLNFERSINPPSVRLFSDRSDNALQPRAYDKKELSRLLGSYNFKSKGTQTLKVKTDDGRKLFVSTTIDAAFQKQAMELVKHSQGYSASLVALDPATGNVLAMASYSKKLKDQNLALKGQYPAASLFKIVTAAAAVELQGLTSQTPVAYDGRNHTLYRRQLKTGLNQGRNRLTLAAGFAKSINAVFGKIGAQVLRPGSMEEYALKFYFNKPIPFELTLGQSEFIAPKPDSFQRAEIASGFNRTTKISPLHGALMVAALVNKGRAMEPTVIREVFDRDNNVFYRHRASELGQVVTAETARQLKQMMKATLTIGTGRVTFGGKTWHRVLSRLEIGGKTGSINDDDGRKVDWFVSFAELPNTSEKIVMAVLVVHNLDTIGVRAIKIARQGLIKYFQPRVKRLRTSTKTKRGEG